MSTFLSSSHDPALLSWFNKEEKNVLIICEILIEALN